jgi:hypothetical protein
MGKKLVTVRGSCAEFCCATGPTQGASVDTHGRWCISAPCADPQLGSDAEGLEWEITTELAAEYLHGAYPRRAVACTRARQIRLSIEPALVHPAAPMPMRVHIGSGEARRLATVLLAAADQADRLDVRLNRARAQRELSQP